jgi:hypothetical protein
MIVSRDKLVTPDLNQGFVPLVWTSGIDFRSIDQISAE